MTYWRLHYHLIWATFNRESYLTLAREKMLYGVLYQKAEELGLKIHAAGNVEDHVHVVASIPPTLAVAECVRHLKGASAYAINHMNGSHDKFKWQGGERSLEKVKEYAAKQKEHHRENKIVAVYERMDEDDE